MTATNDPRMQSFNYGGGWGTDPKPPIYAVAAQLARTLGKRAVDLSQEAWELEMAVRHVRIACLGVEKAQAVARLEQLMEKYAGQEK